MLTELSIVCDAACWCHWVEHCVWCGLLMSLSWALCVMRLVDITELSIVCDAACWCHWVEHCVWCSLLISLRWALCVMWLVYICSINSLEESTRTYSSCVLAATLLWSTKVLVLRYSLKGLLTYHAWMFEPRGKMSVQTKIWLVSASLWDYFRLPLYH